MTQFSPPIGPLTLIEHGPLRPLSFHEFRYGHKRSAPMLPYFLSLGEAVCTDMMAREHHLATITDLTIIGALILLQDEENQ